MMDMNVTEEMKQKVYHRIIECCAIASEEYGIQIDIPHILYNNLGTKAGEANLFSNFVRFNSVFLMEYGDEFIRVTVTHEIAHLIVDKKYGVSGIEEHGEEWKRTMILLGIESPDSHHFYDVTKALPNWHKCNCSCGTIHYLNPYQYSLIVNGTEYICMDCGNLIVLNVSRI